MVKLRKTRYKFEEKVYEETTVVEEQQLPPWEPEVPLHVVGRGIPRVDGVARVMGTAKYTQDIGLAGMLYGKILRCSYPHARIKSIDVARAEKAPGVHYVLSHLNAPRIPWHNDGLLFSTELLYEGDQVAAVVADDPYLAEDASQLIQVDYEQLPFATDAPAALQPGAPAIRPGGNVSSRPQDNTYERGDVEKGFDDADIVFEATYKTQGVAHNCLETHSAVAAWDGDILTVWESTQYIFGSRSSIADALDLPLNKVRVICQYMGGGFGSKQETDKYSVIASLCAMRTGRPVKIALSRREENLSTGHRSPTIQHVKLGAKADGTLTAIEVDSIADIGAYDGYGMEITEPARGLYRCENVRTVQTGAYTNTGPARAFRAPGTTEGIFALESAMDELADELSIDPLEIRLKNYSELDQESGLEYTAKHLREAYQQAAEMIGWKDRCVTIAGSKRRALGMATQTWGGGGRPPAYALVKLNRDGTADLVTGSQDIGTGTKTALVQIAAEELGMPPDDIQIVAGDTMAGPYAPISAGSMTVPSMGPAVRQAASEARRALLEIAAALLETKADDLFIASGRIFSAGKAQTGLSIRDVTRRIGNFTVIGKGARGPNPQGKSISTFGAQFADVEVDTATGEVKVLRIVAVHDCGRVINALGAESQVQGGIIQGEGYAIMEERIMDENTGKLLNANLDQYKIATSMDIPDIDFQLLDIPDTAANPVGAKGLGELSIVPTAPAITNAMFAATGLRVRELPVTRERMIMALRAQEQGNA